MALLKDLFGWWKDCLCIMTVYVVGPSLGSEPHNFEGFSGEEAGVDYNQAKSGQIQDKPKGQDENWSK